MTKKEKIKIVKTILRESDIYRNIKIDYRKLPDYDQEDTNNGFDWMEIASMEIDTFKKGFEDITITPQNDTGNRNIGKHCEIKGQIWTTGRSGSTLYWDKFWKESQGHYAGFKYDEDELMDEEQMSPRELRDMLKDIQFFNEAVKSLMEGFYQVCEDELERVREEAKEAEKAEEDYQKIKKEVTDKKLIKRLVSDLLDS